jgi:carboxylesterase type B
MTIGVLIVTALALVSTTAFAQVVSVTGGQIRGVLLEQGGAVFKGIPYAAPPVGELRWCEPAAVKRWTGLHDATAFAPACAQVSDAMQSYWVNFARTGDPNGPGLPAWPKFTPGTRSYIQFTDAGPAAKEGLRRATCDLLIENAKRQMSK